MKYKIGDHVVIKESNVESIEKFAGRTGVIKRVKDVSWSEYNYWITPDGWEDDCGIWCNVERLIESINPEKIVIITDGKTTTATKYFADGKKVSATAKCSPEGTFDFNVGAKLAMERLMERLMEAISPITVEGFKVGDRVHVGKCNGTIICIANDDALGVEFDSTNSPGIHNCGGVTLKSGKIGKNNHCKWYYTISNKVEHGEYVSKYYNGKIVCTGVDVNDNLYTLGKIYEFIDGTFVCDNGDEVHTWNSDERFESFEQWKGFSGSKWLEIKE